MNLRMSVESFASLSPREGRVGREPERGADRKMSNLSSPSLRILGQPKLAQERVGEKTNLLSPALSSRCAGGEGEENALLIRSKSQCMRKANGNSMNPERAVQPRNYPAQRSRNRGE